MPYVKPAEMVKAQRFIKQQIAGVGLDNVDSDLSDFLNRHPISGDLDDESPYAKVDGVWVRKESVEDVEWEDHDITEWEE